MKQILLIALIVFSIAARHHQAPGQDDPVVACMKKNCKSQGISCSKVKNCPTTITSCSNTFEKSQDIHQFDKCLASEPTAYDLMSCVFKHCLDGGKNVAIEMLLNSMN